MKNFNYISPLPLRVLYAEDNEDARLMTTTLLEFSNIEVITAETIEEAWQIAQAEYFDLYLLDSRFPDGDGLELCRNLHSFAPRTPILIYSGNAYDSDKQKGLAAGADEYLVKPYFDNLAKTIVSAIDHHKNSPVTSNNNIYVEPEIRNEILFSNTEGFGAI